jgi:hypothetical protein
MLAPPGLDAGLLVGRDDKLVAIEGFTVPLTAKAGSRGKIQLWWYQGRMEKFTSVRRHSFIKRAQPELTYFHHEFSCRCAVRQRVVGEFRRREIESARVHPRRKLTGFRQSRCFAKNLPVM